MGTALDQPPPPVASAVEARRFASQRRAPERHLVIVHQPGWQAIEDWYAIAARIVRIDPTIAVFVLSAAVANKRAGQLAAALPSLIFSAGPLGRFVPGRGKIYHGRPIRKFEQLRRLEQAGVRVPRTTVLRPDTRLDPADWGGFVVLKPTDIGSSSRGNGISLMRTERVRYVAPEAYPEGHPGRLGPMLVQHFVDTGPQISAYRVLTLFGQPLYCQLMRSAGPRVDLLAADAAIETAAIAMQAHNAQDMSFVYDADVVALATAAHEAMPEVPLKGSDIIRDVRNGTLYVLEVNPGGNTWHFSSAFLAKERAANGPEFERLRHAQLDAFGTAAHVLARRVRSEAE